MTWKLFPWIVVATIPTLGKNGALESVGIINWKALFYFLVIAIPSVAILTRVIAWIFRPRKKKTAAEEGIQWLDQEEDGAPVGRPYQSYEEYREDLRSTKDWDEILARCRAGVPKNPEKVRQEEWRKRKAAHDKIWDEGRAELDKRMAELACQACGGTKEILLIKTREGGGERVPCPNCVGK